MSVNKLIAIEKAVDKVISQTVLRNSKNYLKPLDKKPWYKPAVKYLSIFQIAVSEILEAQQAEYVKLFKSSETVYIKQAIKKSSKKIYRTDEYLDELHNRVVVPDIIDKLNVLSKKFEELLKQSYEKYISKGLIRDSAELVYKDTAMNFEFNKFDEATRDYLKNKTIKWAKQVNEATEAKIKRILVDGFEKGEGSYNIADRIQKITGFSAKRSQDIARTEIMSACNYTDYIANLQNPNAIGREWSSTRDDRTRATHRAANHQKRKKGEPFNIGGYKMLYPGDTSLGAPAKEVIRCRCTTLTVFEGESLESNTVYDQKGVGTDDWLYNQSEEFQEAYLGGKTKRTLFKNGVISEKDKDTPVNEVLKTVLSKSVKNICEIKGINPSNTLFKDYYRNLIPYILEIQEKGIKGDKEFARIIDYNTGEAVEKGILKDVITGVDGKKEVHITDEHWEEINKSEDKYILIHNHPDGISFSFGDMVALYRNKGLKALIVVGNNGSVYFLSGKGQIPGLPTDEDERKKHIGDTDNELMGLAIETAKKNVGGSSYNRLVKEIKKQYNIIMNDFIKQYGFIYSCKE